MAIRVADLSQVKNWTGSLLPRIFVFTAMFLMGLLIGAPYAKLPPYIGILPIDGDMTGIIQGRFYTNLTQSRLAFFPGQTNRGFGSFELLRDGQPVPPAAEASSPAGHIATFRSRIGDQACIGTACIALSADLLLAVESGAESTIWTTRAAWLRAEVPVNGSLVLRSPTPARLVVTDGDDRHITLLSLAAGTPSSVKYSRYSTFSLYKIFYLLIFSVIIGLFSVYILENMYYTKHSLLLNQPIFYMLCLIVVSIYYFVVFPGFFNADILTIVVNGGTYTSWYSSMYMIYSYIISFLGYRLIQLPAILLCFTAIIYFSNAIKNYANKGALAARSYLLVMLAFNPILFVLMFCAQRQFVALAFVAMGLALVAGGLAEIVKSSRLLDWRAYWSGLAFLGVAALMRPEYGLLFLAIVGFAPFLAAASRWTLVLRAIAAPLAALLLCAAVVNGLVPRLYKENSTSEHRIYRLASILDLLTPYVNCELMRRSESNGEIVAGLDMVGGLDEFCKGNSELFWSKVRPLPPDKALLLTKQLSGGLRHAIIANPTPAIRYFMRRIADTLAQPVWQVFDQYQFRLKPSYDQDAAPFDPDRADHEVQTDDPHSSNADKMGLVMDRPEVALFRGWLLKGFSYTNQPVNYWILGSVFAVVFLFPLLLRHLMLSLVINTAVIFITLAVIAAAPTNNWAYIGLVPIWAIFAYPFAVLERAAVRSKSEARPTKGAAESPV